MPPLAEIWQTAWQAALVPLAVSASVFLIVSMASRSPGAAGLLAFVAGCAAGNHFREVFAFVKPAKPLEWLPCFALAAGAVGLTGGWLGLVLRIAVAGAVGALCVPLDWLAAALAGAVMLHWLLLQRLDRNRPGVLPIAIAISFYSASTVLLYSHSLRLSDIATISGSCALGIAIIALRRGSESGLAAFAAVLLPTLMLIGKHATYSNVPTLSFALVGLSPLLLVPLLAMKSRMGTVIGALPFIGANLYAVAKAMQHESLPNF